ncbi:MAG: tRNA (adenosine(37)-N6)-dimethylallyltransferase MiaA [Acidobacteriota bacterium]|jgi:tRNA dimethylallyltransferase
MPELYPGIIIAGPTASGKSRLGIALARNYKGEIVSCDALQLYRHMHIGTAKVTDTERTAIPHHMLDILDPDEEFSAGAFQSAARDAIESIRERKHVPFIVGGTGFYLSALLEGLFEGPSRNETLRIRMRKIMKRRGTQTLHRALQRIDPQSACRIAETDGERIIRAYEMYLISGKPMSWWHRQPRNALRGYRWLKLGIEVPREELYRRIDSRVDAMFQAGFVDEVRSLLRRFPRISPGFKAIGYRQIIDFLEGNHSLEQAIEETKKESRRYAKRQTTWFHRDPEIVWIANQEDLRTLAATAGSYIDRFLAGND